MTTYTYQWKRDGANISGATSQTYTLVSADVGHNISADVTDTNAAMLSATATAAAVGPITAPDPSAGYALYLPFSAASPTYRVGGNTYSGPTTLPGYSYTRSGAKSELNASGSPVAFGANVAGIIPGVGYWSRGALTNLMLQSQAIDNASWAKTNCTATADSTTAPDGTATADTLAEDATTNFHFIRNGVMAVTSSTAYTLSGFFKAGTYGLVQLASTNVAAYCNFNLVTGVVGSSAGGTGYIISCGNGWYRCVFVRATGGAEVSEQSSIFLINAITDGYAPSYLGSNRTIYAWQLQFILGNHPAGGPVIVTGAATASIGADVLAHTLTAPTDVDQVFFAKINQEAQPATTNYAMQLDDGTTSNRIMLYTDTGNAKALVSSGYNPSIAFTAGVDTILVLQRASGNWRFGTIVGGTLTWASAATAGAFPAGMANNRVAQALAGNSQLDGILLNAGIKVGTFANDAAIVAAVSI